MIAGFKFSTLVSKKLQLIFSLEIAALTLLSGRDVGAEVDISERSAADLPAEAVLVADPELHGWAGRPSPRLLPLHCARQLVPHTPLLEEIFINNSVKHCTFKKDMNKSATFGSIHQCCGIGNVGNVTFAVAAPEP
jgi:hypothetical protein